ncbi:MAG: excalibur calcium-binding domain-containing protein [Frankiaceae bacterium]|nr:excalibur calcium-binding domain-containing protein [Arenimonas sp.]
MPAGRTVIRSESTPHQGFAPAPLAVPTPTSAAKAFWCDGRTYCAQMTSCTEAKFFLNNCPGTKMDGNKDGTPCEQQWCISFLSK